MSIEKKKSEGPRGATGRDGTKRPVPEWLAVKLDFPPDVISGGLRVELRGRNTLLIHGCRRILHYTPCEMRLSVADCVLCITGERLICHSYLAGAVGIEGQINGIFFADDPQT